MEWTLAGSVILSGFVIVFLILIILIGVVNLIGRVVGSISRPQAAAPAPAKQPAAARPSVPALPPAVQQGIGEETVAVIAAAVAASMEQDAPGTAYAITGIQRSRQARPVWGFAGMQQNTRPF